MTSKEYCQQRDAIFEKHQLKIARRTLQLSDISAKILGGMTKEEAKEVISRCSYKNMKRR